MRNPSPIGARLFRRIKRLLDKLELRYVIDRDKDFQLIITGEDPSPQLRILILREGLMREVLAFIVRFEGELPPFTEEEAFRIANNWNSVRRWPRIFWRNGYFHGDFHIDAEADVSQAFLEMNLKHFIGASLQFAFHLAGREEELIRRLKDRFLDEPRLN
ncbi:MAG: YbjN domain-containing protein [Bacteroidia bacterium]